MIFLHIDPSTKNTDLFNKYVEQGKDIFVLFYMEGCGPCNMTRPEWSKIKNVLSHDKNNKVVIADIDQECLKEIKHLKKQPVGFPTLLYISKKGEIVEDLEDSNLPVKERNVDTFINWIHSKKKTHSSSHFKTKKHTKIYKGGKWSRKYKRSINCRRPKGFSQRQYCKYGRNKRKTHSRRS